MTENVDIDEDFVNTNDVNEFPPLSTPSKTITKGEDVLNKNKNEKKIMKDTRQSLFRPPKHRLRGVKM